MNERLWYSQVVEAVFVKGLGPLLTTDLKSTIKREGIDLDRMLPGYPVEQVIRTARKVLPTLFPGQPESEAFHQLGALSMQGYNLTLLGRAAMQLLKLLGVRRALSRLHTSIRSGNNYLDTRFTQLTTTSADLFFSDVSGIPAFYRGLLEEGGRMVGARQMRVSEGKADGTGWTFSVDWQE